MGFLYYFKPHLQRHVIPSNYIEQVLPFVLRQTDVPCNFRLYLKFRLYHLPVENGLAPFGM